MTRLDLDFAQLQSTWHALLVSHPELADDEELRADVLEGETEAHAILGKLLDRQREARMQREALKVRAALISARDHMFERHEDSARIAIEAIMRLAGLRKVQLPEATLSIGFSPPSVKITDEAALPEAFIRTTREPDKVALKKALQDGQHVPGAYLSNGCDRLTVRG